MNYSIIAITIMIIIMTTIYSFDVLASEDIPNWIKTVALLWGQGTITNAEFVSAMEYLIEQKIIVVSNTNEQETHTDVVVPPKINSNIPSNNDATIINSDLSDVYANPNKFKNYAVEIHGSVESISVYGDGTTIVFDTSNEIFGSIDERVNIVSSSKNLNIIQDNCYMIKGIILGEYEAQFILTGVPIIVPLIDLGEYEEKSCFELRYPTIKKINVDKTDNDGSVEVTIKTIEFTNDHTRIFIDIENIRTSGDITFGFDPKIIQNKKQYTSQYLFEEYDDIVSDIPPNVIESGYVIFDPVPINSKDPLLIMLDMYDSNFNSHDFEFYIRQ